MRREELFDFLTTDYQGPRGQSMSIIPARDVCSWCNRVESTLRLNLDNAITGQENELIRILHLMDERIDSFNIDGNKVTSDAEGIARLKTAVRRYHNFRYYERDQQ